MLGEAIEKELAVSGLNGHYDPRHIEAWIRMQHGSLSNVPPAYFEAEVRIARLCCDGASGEQSERLALSFGL